MLAGDFFITPRAVRQFQSRIAPGLSCDQALGAIIRGLCEAKDFHATANGKAQYVRTRGEWQLRAIIVAGADDAKPAVTTILRSGKGRRTQVKRGATAAGEGNKICEFWNEL